MKPHALLLSGCLMASGVIHAEESALPPELRTARFRYEVELVELNQKYTRFLSQLKEDYMNAGKLDEALAVDVEIKRVAKLSPVRQAIPKTDEELRDYLKGTKWKMSGEKVITFQESGEVHKNWGRLRPTWVVKGMQVEYESKVFSFSSDFTEIKLVKGESDAGKTGTLITP